VAKSAKPEPNPTEPRRENLPLATLVPHPDQEKYFRRYGAAEYAALKADVQKNGLRHPIEVLPGANAAGLPPHTIVVGHTRRRILQELGHTKSELP
jgi:hypothetical protein